MADLEEFSPEQQVVLAIMRCNGVSDPEAVVRADRLQASLVGCHLLPVLDDIAASLRSLLQAFAEVQTKLLPPPGPMPS